jgi:very-short-patch-repair endonuclease
MPRKAKWVGAKWTSKRPGQRRIKIPQPAYRPIHITSTRVKRVETRPTALRIHRKGPYRTKVGPADRQELRAVQNIRGTLPERIMYKALMQHKYQPNVDFDFQTSLLGGRLTLGGIVADFIFPYRRIIIQIQGPTHAQFIRKAKDSEQRELLEAMGYRSIECPMEIIMNGFQLDIWIRKNIDSSSHYAGGAEAVEGTSSFRKYTDEE